MATTTPPFRAEHIGSLLRPRQLTQAFSQFRANEIVAAEFHAIQDAAVREVLELQESVGLECVGDGEFRRASYWAHWVDAIDGLDIATAAFRFHDAEGKEQPFTAANCVGPLVKSGLISTAEFAFTRAHTSKTVKLTMPSPSTLHFWRLGATIESSPYASHEAYFEDLCAIYREEIADLAALGCTYIQLDEVPLIMLANGHVRARVRNQGEDPDRLTELYIEALNQAIRDCPDSLTVGMHVCRGNFKGKWLVEGGYEAIAERVFGATNVHVFCLEFDTERAGGFEPLRFVPAGKKVVLGLVSTKTPELESSTLLRNRIEEASRYMPLQDLCISPQCGFASTVAGNPVTLEDEVAKLKLIVQTAREVWG